MTLETLHLVFSAFGYVQKIATFEKGQGFQALVQYADAETAEQVQSHLDSFFPSTPLLAAALTLYRYTSAPQYDTCTLL